MMPEVGGLGMGQIQRDLVRGMPNFDAIRRWMKPSIAVVLDDEPERNPE